MTTGRTVTAAVATAMAATAVTAATFREGHLRHRQQHARDRQRRGRNLHDACPPLVPLSSVSLRLAGPSANTFRSGRRRSLGLFGGGLPELHHAERGRRR